MGRQLGPTVFRNRVRGSTRLCRALQWLRYARIAENGGRCIGSKKTNFAPLAGPPGGNLACAGLGLLRRLACIIASR